MAGSQSMVRGFVSLLFWIEGAVGLGKRFRFSLNAGYIECILLRA